MATMMKNAMTNGMADMKAQNSIIKGPPTKHPKISPADSFLLIANPPI